MYVFPEKEEEYITRIVEIIQRNDLDNKRENIKAQTSVVREDETNTNINQETIVWND